MKKQRRLLGFHWSVQFSGANASLNKSLVPFLLSLSKFFKPNDTLLQIYLSKLNKNMF